MDVVTEGMDVVLSVVGRMAAAPVPDEVDTVLEVAPDGGMQDVRGAQVYPLSQHPPPKLIGQAFQFGEHIRVVCSAVLVKELVDGVIVLTVVLVFVVAEAPTVRISVTITVTTRAGSKTPKIC